MPARATGRTKLRVRFVRGSCGVAHSLAIDDRGGLWTWGGGGGSMLGHGDPPMMGASQTAALGSPGAVPEGHENDEIKKKEQVKTDIATADATARAKRIRIEPAAAVMHPSRRPWLRPRLVRSLPGTPPRMIPAEAEEGFASSNATVVSGGDVIQAAGGALHSAILTRAGRVFMFGEDHGCVLGLRDPPSDKVQHDNADDDDGGEEDDDDGESDEANDKIDMRERETVSSRGDDRTGAQFSPWEHNDLTASLPIPLLPCSSDRVTSPDVQVTRAE